MGAGAGAGRAGAALLAGAGALPGAALASVALAVWEGLFFTMVGAALGAGLAATLDAGLAWAGTGLPLALEGVVLAAGAGFLARGLLAVWVPAFCGAGVFTAEVGLAAAGFAAVVFLAGVGLGFLAAGLAAVLVAVLTAGLAADLTGGLAFTAGRGGAFLATALTGLADAAALPALWATGLALVTAAPFLVLAVDMQGLLRF